jgi:AraC family transcriptional regulator
MKTKSLIDNLLRPTELKQRLNTNLVLSSRQIGWNGILVEHYQHPPAPAEIQLPAISDHWVNLHLGHPAHLAQKRDGRLHESMLQKGDSLFVPAGQPSYWRCRRTDTHRPMLHIHLKPALLEQASEASEIDRARINLVDCFGKQDLQLHHIAMLLLTELRSGGIMGQLYVESLTQVLAIHLLRHYSTLTQPITSENRRLTHAQVQQATDYIHTHLGQELSLGQIAEVINISPTYFASLFKRATGTSPHQYVVQQRVERAKLMLSKTNLAIADIAFQVGFSSQSHLTRQFKRITGMTPKQVR